MKKIALGIIGSIMATTVMADVADVAVVTDVQKIYRQTPIREETKVCHDEQVPVYGTEEVHRSASPGEVIIGGIIGGAIGNQVGGGSGKDAATVLGAIIGAEAADKNYKEYRRVLVGYETRRVCNRHYKTTHRNTVSGYKVGYMVNGYYGQFTTDIPYNIGDELDVEVRVRVR